MRKLIYIGIVLIAFATPVYATNDARFDFTNGQPAVMEDTTSTCTDTATIRYDFTSGTPSPIFDATTNCTAVAQADTSVSGIRININGNLNVNGIINIGN